MPKDKDIEGEGREVVVEGEVKQKSKTSIIESQELTDALRLRQRLRSLINQANKKLMSKGERSLVLCALRNARMYPPASSADMFVRPGFGSDAYNGLIDNKDILDIHCAPSDYLYSEFGGKLSYGRTEFGEHVLQQVGWWGCSAATVQMLKLDYGMRPDPMDLLLSHLGTSCSRTHQLELSGFEVFHFSKNFGSAISFRRNDIPLIEELVKENGSAIVTVYPRKLGVHAIIIDELSRGGKQARIRDPFHGWSVTVTLGSLRRLLRGPLDLIQVKRATTAAIGE